MRRTTTLQALSQSILTNDQQYLSPPTKRQVDRRQGPYFDYGMKRNTLQVSPGLQSTSGQSPTHKQTFTSSPDNQQDILDLILESNFKPAQPTRSSGYQNVLSKWGEREELDILQSQIVSPPKVPHRQRGSVEAQPYFIPRPKPKPAPILEYDTIRLKPTVPIAKQQLLTFNNDIEDFFKIGDLESTRNQYQHVKNRQRKVLKNLYELITFTEWVEELFGKDWFHNTPSPLKRQRTMKVQEEEFLKGLSFSK